MMIDRSDAYAGRAADVMYRCVEISFLGEQAQCGTQHECAGVFLLKGGSGHGAIRTNVRSNLVRYGVAVKRGLRGGVGVKQADLAWTKQQRPQGRALLRGAGA